MKKIPQAVDVHVPSGTTIFDIGDPCRQFIAVAEGSVRVDLLTSTGRTILLYRLSAGDTCTMTSACLLGDSLYSATAVAETDVKAQILSTDQFKSLIVSDTEFQTFVFKGLYGRLSNLMTKVAEGAFTSIDARLATRLLDIADAQDTIRTTHDQLATDIGSAREVISRKLLGLERDGLLERGRGEIKLIDRSQLQKLSSSGDRT